MPINILFIIMSHKPELVASSSFGYNNKQFYDKLEIMMRKYYNIMDVDYKFIKCDPEIKEEYTYEGDIILVKSPENMKEGIFKKTKRGLIYGKNYDFIYKTTLCCVPNIELITEFCKTKINDKYLYAGPKVINKDTGLEFVGGYGILLNKNTASLLLDNWNDIKIESEDESIALTLKNLGVIYTEINSFPIHNTDTRFVNSNKLSYSWISNLACNLVHFHVFKICIFKEMLDPEIHLKIQEFICNTYQSFSLSKSQM